MARFLDYSVGLLKLKFDVQDGEMAEKRATTAVLGLARGWDIEVCR